MADHPMMTWRRRDFVVPEDTLTDEMCWAATLYQGPISYDEPLLRNVTATVTWWLIQLTHGGVDRNAPLPIDLH